MLNYSFSKRMNPPYFLSIDFHPELELLSAYLFQVFDRRIYEWIKEGIDSVFNQGVASIERDVEWYGAKIQPETTLIYSTLEDNSQEINEISTADFDAVLTVWFQEKEKYDAWKRQRTDC